MVNIDDVEVAILAGIDKFAQEIAMVKFGVSIYTLVSLRGNTCLGRDARVIFGKGRQRIAKTYRPVAPPPLVTAGVASSAWPLNWFMYFLYTSAVLSGERFPCPALSGSFVLDDYCKHALL